MANEERNLSHATAESIDELEGIKEWWHAHGDTITIVILAVLVAVIGFQQYGRWNVRREARAMQAFEAAASADALEQIISENTSRSVTPLARLRLAGVFFRQEKYDLAQSVYEAFLADTPDHELADIARVGLAHALEANHEIEAAVNHFRAFTETRANSFLAPMATIGLGRTLILAGRRDEGKAVLDLFITETAGTRWAGFADEILRSRDRLTLPETTGAIELASFFSDADTFVEPTADTDADEAGAESSSVEADVMTETEAEAEAVPETPAD